MPVTPEDPASRETYDPQVPDQPQNHSEHTPISHLKTMKRDSLSVYALLVLAALTPSCTAGPLIIPLIPCLAPLWGVTTSSAGWYIVVDSVAYGAAHIVSTYVAAGAVAGGAGAGGKKLADDKKAAEAAAASSASVSSVSVASVSSVSAASVASVSVASDMAVISDGVNAAISKANADAAAAATAYDPALDPFTFTFKKRDEEATGTLSSTTLAQTTAPVTWFNRRTDALPTPSAPPLSTVAPGSAPPMPPGVPEYNVRMCQNDIIAMHAAGQAIGMGIPEPNAVRVDNVPSTCMVLATVMLGSPELGPHPVPMGATSLQWNNMTQENIDKLATFLNSTEPAA